MAFRKPKQQPEFADLKGILAQNKKTDDPLYQTIEVLIERLTQFRGVTLEQIADINNSVNSALTTINFMADRRATYHTKDDETLRLPNSWRLEAGVGIAFDDSTPNLRIISGAAAAFYDCPLTDGNVDETDLIFAAGECIIVQVPV